MKADYLRTRLLTQVDSDETRAKLFEDYEAATIPYLAAERFGRKDKLASAAKDVLEAFTAIGPFQIERMEEADIVEKGETPFRKPMPITAARVSKPIPGRRQLPPRRSARVDTP